jgi:hypothetical protein
MIRKGSPVLHTTVFYRSLIVVVLLLLCAAQQAVAQSRHGQNDPINPLLGQPTDTLKHGDTAVTAPVGPLVISDSSGNMSVPNLNDSVGTKDTSVPSLTEDQDEESKTRTKEQELGIRISKDALPAKVVTTAKDSAVMDMTQNLFYLYGDADVKYQEINLKGGKITFDQSSSVVTAEPEKDTSGKSISLQEFSQGKERFTYDSLQYNFKSKRAIVRNARSQYGEGFVISEQVKRNADETIFGWKNIYTTCNLPHPHFGIRANKIKVVPNKVIASGPANLTVQDIPTPLWLPFGIFPAKQGQSSGFIIPSYTLEGGRGLGFQRGGYYFNISPYIGLTTTFDIFTKGSWAFAANANYAKRYQFNGSVQLGYNYTKTGESFDPNASIRKDFRIGWTHTQDPKASPGSNFAASVNIASVGYNSLNSVEAQRMLENNFSSSISYSKSWIGKPFSFSAALRQSQNNQSGLWVIGLPEINFGVGNFTPFQRKRQIGSPKWYERITSSYNMRLINNWSFYDSTFNMGNLQFKDFNNGIVQNVNIQATYNIFRFINLNFNLPYTEYWNTKQAYLNYNEDRGLNDTTVNMGFFASRSFNTSASLSTRIYGVKMFKKGKIAGLRHVMTPSVGFTYQPGFAHHPFNYYYMYEGAEGTPPIYRSPYELTHYTPIGGPTPPDPGGSITFGLNNTLGMKVRTADSNGTKNISLIDGLNISGFYNLFADSNKLSNISITGRTSILKIVNVSGNMVFDPYVYQQGRRTGQYLAEAGQGLANFRAGSIQAGFSYSAQKRNKEDQEEAEKGDENIARLLRNGAENYYDFNVPFDFNVNYSMSAVRRYNTLSRKDTVEINHNLTFAGSLTLTERWRINFQSGYIFSQKKFGTTSINISRDLHCWQMSLNLIPFGEYRSFNFLLQVKSSLLQDLKLVRRKSYLDNNF